LIPSTDAVKVTDVDGDSIFYNGKRWQSSKGLPTDPDVAPQWLELLPGPHTITFVPYSGSGSPITEEIDVEADKTYRARARFSNMQVVSQQRLGDATRYTITTQYVGQWSVEITEQPPEFCDRCF
jgi:hypothetical protein